MAFQAAEDTEQSSKTWVKGDKAHLSRQVEQVMSSNAWFGCRMAALKKTSGFCSVMPKRSILKMHTSKRQRNLHQPHLFFLQPRVNHGEPVNRIFYVTCQRAQKLHASMLVTTGHTVRSLPGDETQEKHLRNRFYQLILAENESH